MLISLKCYSEDYTVIDMIKSSEVSLNKTQQTSECENKNNEEETVLSKRQKKWKDTVLHIHQQKQISEKDARTSYDIVNIKQLQC